MTKPTSLHAVMAFACALALACALLPGAAMAASPAPTGTSGERPPSIMKLAADDLAKPPAATARPAAAPAAGATPSATRSAVPAAARPNREVFGFAQAGALGPGSGRGWNTWDYSLLTTVAYFGLHVNSGDGNLVKSSSDTGWTVWNSNDVGDMINAAHGAGARAVLTIVSQENAANMCQSLLHASATIPQAVEQMRARRVEGINVDYESGNGPCGGSDNRTLLRNLVASLRAQMDSDGVHHHLTVDTYASSAADSGGFYDVAGMAQYVDAFFVMAYPLDDSNWGQPPLHCSVYCFSPTSPASAYRWNDDLVAQQYVSAAGASKTILGLPYFGYAACVLTWDPNAYPTLTPHWTVPTMWTLDGIASAPNISNYVEHVDVYDHVSRYATYHGTGTDMKGQPYDCNREFYVDSAASLGSKYDIVNNRGLAGAGIWSLDYGGGIPALWDQIAAHFTYRPGAPGAVHACPGDGFAVVNWSPPASGAAPITSNLVTASPGGASITVGATNQAVVRGLSDGSAYTMSVQAGNAYGRGPAGLSPPVTPVSSAGTWPGQYHSLSPKRIIDSRNGAKLQPGQVVSVPVLNSGGIPGTGVAAVVLNVTATNATAPGYLLAYAAGSCQPLASNLNFGPGATGTNLVTVAVGAGGAVSFVNGSNGTTDLLADVAGWISTAPTVSGGEGALRPLVPSRLIDTRDGTGGKGTLLAGNPISVQVTNRAGVPPSGVSAVVLNVTVTNPRADGFVAVFPGDTAWPGNSNVNFVAGQTVPNRVVVKVSASGQVQFVSSVITDVIADVGGWFTDASAAPGGGMFTGSTPVRLVDTRDGTGGVGALGPGQPFALQITGQPGVPTSGVTAVVLNVTATDATAAGFVTVYPSDVHWPLASDLNTAPGRTVANQVIARVSPGGQVSFINSAGSVNLIVDLVGWYG